MARKLYAYAKGIDTEEVDAATFKSAYQGFADSGYRMRTLIKGLVESPEFFDTSTTIKQASARQ